MMARITTPKQDRMIAVITRLRRSSSTPYCWKKLPIATFGYSEPAPFALLFCRIRLVVGGGCFGSDIQSRLKVNRVRNIDHHINPATFRDLPDNIRHLTASMRQNILPLTIYIALQIFRKPLKLFLLLCAGHPELRFFFGSKVGRVQLLLNTLQLILQALQGLLARPVLGF